MLLGAGTFLAVWGNPYLLAHLVYLTAVLLIVPFIIVFPTAVPDALSAFPTLVLPAVAQLAVPIAFCFLAWVLWPQKPLFGTWSRRALIRLRGVCVTLAVVVPVGFAVIRLAWAIGIPLGIDESFREANQDYVSFGYVTGLATTGAAALTFGLTRSWSARLPSGRPIRIGLVRNAGIIVGTAAIAAGSYYVRTRLVRPTGSPAQQQVGTWIAEVFWPIWGIALIVAVLVYAELRRRDEPRATCIPGP